MPRKKLQKIEALHNLSNVLEMTDADLKNKLATWLAANKNITLELGCGKGDYTLALAKNSLTEKFIGIDIQGERLWHGASTALKEKLNNVLFLRIAIEDIDKLFKKNSIKEIWLTFPDPQNKNGDIKKRLTSPRFLNIYKNILQTNNLLHLKTDNQKLFDYSKNSIKEFGSQILLEKILLNTDAIEPKLAITTYYEKIYRKQNKDIYYLQAKL